jgi:tetratricopeptide (TPR) repeat protein
MKLLLRMLLLMVPGFLQAQDLDQARKSIYYEKQNSAVKILHAALKSQPANVDAWYWLSQALYESGQQQKFIDTFRFAPPQITDEPVYKIIQGEILLKNGKKDSASLYFNQALKATKQKNAFVLSAIANAHIEEKTGDGNYAIELLNKAIKRDKKNPALYTMLGDAYRKINNGSEAFKMYRQALEMEPRYAAAAHKLGKIFFSQNNYIYLNHFNQAVAADPNYAPAYYDLYYHYYFIDPAKAIENFKKYVAASDYDINNEYLYADLLYLNKKYNEAIAKTKKLMTENKLDTMPRLHKLLAYSYAGLKDTASAIQEMEKFLSIEVDTSHIAKDYEFIADLYASTEAQKDSAIVYYQKVISTMQDSSKVYVYYKKLADLSKEIKDYYGHANWLGKYYQHNKNASNLDLFNWGIAHFKSEQYNEADSVFALYTEKYPDQSYGYYWRARSNALLDSAMESGLAIPHYKQLVALIEKDTSDATNRKWLIESYGYIAAYETNKEKDYKDAIEYLEKVLALDPENKNAKDYIALLEQTVEAKEEKD